MPARTLTSLRREAADCRACPLWENATQTVFGEGSPRSMAMLVGEQPGDREDRDGAPFVGPAGRVLDEALAAAGIDRCWSELAACRPWLEAELAVVKPRVLVCLGATAAQSLLGRQSRVTRQRGEWVESDLAEHVMATIHPSAILRAGEDREREMEGLVADPKLVAGVL